MDTVQCAWCHKHVPVDQAVDFALTIDENTGMVDSSKPVCNACMEPIWKEQSKMDDDNYCFDGVVCNE